MKVDEFIDMKKYGTMAGTWVMKVEDVKVAIDIVRKESKNLGKLRATAAIAALPECIQTARETLKLGGRFDGPIPKRVAESACLYADALIEELKKEGGV